MIAIKNKKGQTLIEAVVALGAAVVVITSIAIAVITSVNNADFSKNQNLATQYAQQGMDSMRHLSESDWNSFSTYGGSYCTTDDPTNLTPKGGTCQTMDSTSAFKREIDVTSEPLAASNCAGNVLVKVIVSWNDGKCTTSSFCHSVELDSCLANINNYSSGI